MSYRTGSFFSSDRVGNDDNFILNKKLDGHSIAGDSSSFIEYRDRICPYPYLVNLKIKEKIQIQESRQMVYFYEDYPASAYHFEKMCSNKEESDDYNLYKGNLSVKKGHGFPRKKKNFLDLVLILHLITFMIILWINYVLNL